MDLMWWNQSPLSRETVEQKEKKNKNVHKRFGQSCPLPNAEELKLIDKRIAAELNMSHVSIYSYRKTNLLIEWI